MKINKNHLRNMKNKIAKGKITKNGLSPKTLHIISNLDSSDRYQRDTDIEDEEELRQSKEEKKTTIIKILLLGDSGVGKTSLMMRYTDDQFTPGLLSTAGVDFKIVDLNVDGRHIRCQIWDTAGQDKFHVITRAYYRGAHGIVLVYDIGDSDSFKNVNYWMASIETHKRSVGREAVHKVLIGNKMDLSLEEREVSREEGIEASKEYGIEFHEVSAKSGENVNETFQSVIAAIVKGLELEEQVAAGEGGLRIGNRLSCQAKTKGESSNISDSHPQKCILS